MHVEGVYDKIVVEILSKNICRYLYLKQISCFMCSHATALHASEVEPCLCQHKSPTINKSHMYTVEVAFYFPE